MSKERIELHVSEANGELKVTPVGQFISEGVDTPKPTLQALPQEVVAGWDYAPWGLNNQRPNEVRRALAPVAIAGQTLEKLAKMMYGNGLYYYDAETRAREGHIKRAYNPEVEHFLEANEIGTQWLFPQILDYKYHYNAFSEFVLSRDKQKITGLSHKEAEFCRLSRQNPRTKVIEYLLYSTRFAYDGHPPKGEPKAIPLMPWFNKGRFIQKLRKRKFAWHSRVKNPSGAVYYPRQPWLGLMGPDGWLEVSKNVPGIVNAMQRNQIALKYIIYIPVEYMALRHEGFMSYTDEQKQAAIKKLSDHYNASLKGTDNLYKSITTMFTQDRTNKMDIGRIEIVAVDNKLKENAWIPSSETADTQVVAGLGGSPTIAGLANSAGKMGAGSGSDKREMYNIEISTNTIDQDIILRPLNLISIYNGWGVRFGFDHMVHTTKDKNDNGIAKPNDSNKAID